MEGWYREPLALELNQYDEYPSILGYQPPNSCELTNGIKNLSQQTDPQLFENF
ncbi:conserved hypothetical protein [Vibrio harveyi]|nr:conserved hypothetical protein [Vibrio harveyi]CAH1572070.1 conserved hypothetical protein [Vibrio harveyi]CAH1585527.1 conserved hypothetical protein [Vibrio harveyi]